MADDGVYYSPYQPVQMPGGMFMQAAASAGFDYASSMFGAPMTPMGFPQSYSNPMTYASRMSQDRFFNQMVEQAAYRDRMNVMNTWTPVGNMFANAAGKQITQQQMDAMLKFSTKALQMASPMMMTNASTRYMMDLGAGGNSEVNMAFGLTNIRKQFRDPFSLGEHMSVATADTMAETMFREMYGQGNSKARFDNSGFRAGEQVDIMNWAQSKGWLGSPMAQRRDYTDPFLIASIKAGHITDQQLEAAGRGDLMSNTGLLGNTLEDEDSKKLAAQYAGGRMASSLQDAGKALRAVKDIFEKSDIFLTATELMQATDRMTSRYGQQISGQRVAQSLRVTNQIARNLKLGAREQGVIGDLTANALQQYGYESGMELDVVQNAFLMRKSMRDAGVFETKRYGAMNEEQAMQASITADAAYGRTQYANRVAVLERLRLMGMTTDDAQLNQYMEELRQGTTSFSDESIFTMSEAEWQAKVAKMRDAAGQEIGGATVDIMSQQTFANESVTEESDLLRYRTQAQRRDLYNTDFAYNASRAYGAQFRGAGDARDLSRLTSEMSKRAYDITMDASDTSDIAMSKVATEQLRYLQQQAAGGNATAQAMLDKLGKDEATQINALRQGNMIMFAEQGNYGNNVSMLNQSVADSMRANKADAEAGAWLESSLAATNSSGLGDSFLAMARSIKGKGLNSREAMYSALGELVNAKETKMSNEQIQEAVNPIMDAYEQYDAALQDAQKNGASDEVKASLASKKAALATQLEKLQKEFGSYATSSAESQKAAAQQAGSQQGTGGGPMELQMSGVTININGVEVGSNLTADGKGRRTEAPK